jgi:hypothetical protein
VGAMTAKERLMAKRKKSKKWAHSTTN